MGLPTEERENEGQLVLSRHLRVPTTPRPGMWRRINWSSRPGSWFAPRERGYAVSR